MLLIAPFHSHLMLLIAPFHTHLMLLIAPLLSLVATAVTEDFQNMLVAAAGGSCSVLHLSYQPLSSWAFSYISSRYMTELRLNGIAATSSGDVRRLCDSCPLLRVSLSKHCCTVVRRSERWNPQVLSLEHCIRVGDDAFLFDKCTNLQEVNVSFCVALTDVGILRLLSYCPRLLMLNM
jgi:hypothetical protein